MRWAAGSLSKTPATTCASTGTTWSEIDFLTELTRRTGCGLLVDINNIFISAHNLAFDAHAFLDALPAASHHGNPPGRSQY